MKRASSDRPRWLTDARARKLGTVPDTVIARAAGVDRGTVRRWRRKLGIPSYCPSRGAGLFG